MHIIRIIKTNDGSVHANEADALAHLDKKLDDELNPLAHKLALHNKYVDICQILEESTETFRKIVALRDEMAAGVRDDDRVINEDHD